MLARREALVAGAACRRRGVRRRRQRSQRDSRPVRAAVVEAHLAELLRAFPPASLAEAQRLRARRRQCPARARKESTVARVPLAFRAPRGPTSHTGTASPSSCSRRRQVARELHRKVGVLPKDKQRPELAQLKANIESPRWNLPDMTNCTNCCMQPRAADTKYEDAEWQRTQVAAARAATGRSGAEGVFAERRWPIIRSSRSRRARPSARRGADRHRACARRAPATRARRRIPGYVRSPGPSCSSSLTAGWEPGDGRTLFLVGDPMQSIYRFRNAEVGLFLDVRDRGLGRLPLEPLTLRVNFRSTRPLVDWINACFAQVLPARDDVLRGAVQFAESVAAPDAGVTAVCTSIIPALEPLSRRRPSPTSCDARSEHAAARSPSWCRDVPTSSRSSPSSPGAVSRSRRRTSIRCLPACCPGPPRAHAGAGAPG